MASEPVVHDAEHADLHVHEHPSQAKYVQIAIFLAIITAVEVAIYYIDALSGILVPTLIILSVIKFITVVGYFMHLKFDSKLLTWTFTAAMLISLAVFIGTWLVMNYDAVEQFTGDMSI